MTKNFGLYFIIHFNIILFCTCVLCWLHCWRPSVWVFTLSPSFLSHRCEYWNLPCPCIFAPRKWNPCAKCVADYSRLRTASSPAVGSGRTGQYVFQVRSDELGHWVSRRVGVVKLMFEHEIWVSVWLLVWVFEFGTLSKMELGQGDCDTVSVWVCESAHFSC